MEKTNMKKIDEYLKNEEQSIKKEIENILRKMCEGKNYREWSEDMIDKLYFQIYQIMEVDLDDQDEEIGRLEITEEMVVTAMMMYTNVN